MTHCLYEKSSYCNISISASFKQRMRDIEDDLDTIRPHRIGFDNKGSSKRVPIVIESLPSRDLFAEDADQERRDDKEQEVVSTVRSQVVGSEKEKEGVEGTGEKGVKENGTTVVDGDVKMEAEEDDVERALKHTNTDSFEFQDDYTVADERVPAGDGEKEGVIDSAKKVGTDDTGENVSEGNDGVDNVELVATVTDTAPSAESAPNEISEKESEKLETVVDTEMDSAVDSNVVPSSNEVEEGEIENDSNKVKDNVEEPVSNESEPVVDSENNNAPVLSSEPVSDSNPVSKSGLVGVELSEKDKEQLEADEIDAMIEKFVEGEPVF